MLLFLPGVLLLMLIYLYLCAGSAGTIKTLAQQRPAANTDGLRDDGRRGGVHGSTRAAQRVQRAIAERPSRPVPHQ